MCSDETYMRRCFDLARNGMGLVAPNPLVGCVIVKDDCIIGEGFHQVFGEAHAEVNAINSVADSSLLSGSTLYVNLEPCCHFGKTPPCCNLILKHNIKRVVVCNTDPNPLVAGLGIQKLKDAGLDVVVGILHNEGWELNKRFFTFITQKRPYIILKWAKTLDGFMDINCEDSHQNYWITNDLLRVLVHRWRSEEAAILVGTNTAKNDNPQLNLRYWQGKQPLRIVLDRNLKLSPTLHLFDGSQPTLIYTEKEAVSQNNLTYSTINFNDLLPQMMSDLYNQGIQSLIVEGGKQLLESFITVNLWDEARVLTGNKEFKKGLKAPEIPQASCESFWAGNDKVSLYLNY